MRSGTIYWWDVLKSYRGTVSTKSHAILCFWKKRERKRFHGCATWQHPGRGPANSVYIKVLFLAKVKTPLLYWSKYSVSADRPFQILQKIWQTSCHFICRWISYTFLILKQKWTIWIECNVDCIVVPVCMSVHRQQQKVYLFLNVKIFHLYEWWLIA